MAHVSYYDNTPTAEARIARLRQLAWLIDAAFKLPGSRFRFGLNSVIGLTPAAGNALLTGISLYIVNEARRLGLPKWKLALMLKNVAIEAAAGTVPLLGDLFDVAFKSNMRNIRLMREHYVEGRHRGGAWKIVVPFLLLLLLIIGGAIWLLYKFFAWLF